MEVDEILTQLAKDMRLQRHNDSNGLEKELRRKFLEQGLENALMKCGIEVSKSERAQLLNQLDSDIFSL